MAEPIIVEVVSPEAVLYSGEADMVITRTLGGGEVGAIESVVESGPVDHRAHRRSGATPRSSSTRTSSKSPTAK